MKKNEKIFYIGFQRSGTKSFRTFMETNNINVATWRTSADNKWPEHFYNGDYKKIVDSDSFNYYQAFEDAPWYQLELIEYIYKEISSSKFVFLERPAEDWFKSMVKHSAGMTLGKLRRHCYIYKRDEDFNFIENNYTSLENYKFFIFDNASHYIKIYKQKIKDIKEFAKVNDPKGERIFIGNLYEKNIYDNIGLFLGFKKIIKPKKITHESKITFKDVLDDIEKAKIYLYKLRKARKKVIRVKEKEFLIQSSISNFKSNKNSISGQNRLAETYFRFGYIKDAMKLSLDLYNKNKEYPPNLLLLSKIYEKQKNYKSAIKYLTEHCNIIGDVFKYKEHLKKLKNEKFITKNEKNSILKKINLKLIKLKKIIRSYI
jgi:hypothetical protein